MAKELKGFELYRELKARGFPQGGVGSFMEDPNGTEKVYVPHPSEIYASFVGDPSQWNALRDAMIQVWLKNKK